MGEQGRDKRRRFYRVAADLLNVGLIFPSAIAVGYVAGYFLDRWLETSPWLAVALSIAGAVAAFVNLFRVASRLDQ